MKKLNVFKIVKMVPPESNKILYQWVFKYKKDENGNIL